MLNCWLGYFDSVMLFGIAQHRERAMLAPFRTKRFIWAETMGTFPVGYGGKNNGH